MKGVIFTSLSDLVIEKFGLGLWDEVIRETNLPSKGSYTATGTYEFEELAALVQKLSEKVKIPIPILLESYGQYVFPVFAKKYSVFLQNQVSLKEFIKEIDKVIHVEVKKLYPDASLPKLWCEDLNEDSLVLFYRSPRQLCSLAIGLLKGAGAHFNTSVQVRETECMHKGNDHCRLEIYFG